MKLPEYKVTMTICHNDHKSVYETAERWLLDMGDWGDWESDEAKQRAIAADSIWSIQWYPETPVGFIALFAPTLEELLEFAQKETPQSG